MSKKCKIQIYSRNRKYISLKSRAMESKNPASHIVLNRITLRTREGKTPLEAGKECKLYESQKEHQD